MSLEALITPSQSLPLSDIGSRRSGRVPAWQLLSLADAWALSLVALVLPGRIAVPFAAVAFGALVAQRCYSPRFNGQLGSVLGRLFVSVSVAAVAVGSVADAWAGVLLRLALVVFAAMVVGRAVAGALLRACNARAEGAPTLIVGAGALGAQLARAIEEHPEYGLRAIGVIDDVGDEDLPLPLLGGTRELGIVAERLGVEHVMVAFGKTEEHQMVEVLRTCEALDAEVWVVPRLFELGSGTDSSDEIWGIPLDRLPRTALRTSQWRLKRAFDVAATSAILLLTAPLMAVIAAAVKLTSPGPVFFRQARVGERGELIDVLKFRSMAVNDDADTTWNVTADSRVTAIGRIIRPTSLDELPQLFNVLRGDMSLVGPRPERPHFVDLFSDSVRGYAHRHRVPVGLTGLAQVNGLRGDTSIEERARFDNRYIEHWSLWTDLVILVRTVGAVLRPAQGVRIEAPAATEPMIDIRDDVEAPEAVVA